MAELRRWLKGFGFGAYAEAFEAEKVDILAVPQLSAHCCFE